MWILIKALFNHGSLTINRNHNPNDQQYDDNDSADYDDKT